MKKVIHLEYLTHWPQTLLTPHPTIATAPYNYSFLTFCDKQTCNKFNKLSIISNYLTVHSLHYISIILSLLSNL
mgnify:CR=1 FL=1|jgi:hypothetical protein